MLARLVSTKKRGKEGGRKNHRPIVVVLLFFVGIGLLGGVPVYAQHAERANFDAERTAIRKDIPAEDKAAAEKELKRKEDARITAASHATGFIIGILTKVLLYISKLMVGLMSVLISLLLVVASYNDFIDGPGVIVGWTLLRDIVNMFFIVVLLVIAFATMLGAGQHYHVKTALPRLLLAAVAVNFSRLIVGFVIDVAQVVMMTFVNAIAQIGAGNFLQAFQVSKMFDISAKAAGVALEDFIGSLLIAILLFIAAVVVGMFAVMLVLRMVALWFLIALSPVAFFLKAIPGGAFAKYSGMWTEKFQANVILGPVLAFFLWLSLAMVGDGNIYGKVRGGDAADTGGAEASSYVKSQGFTSSAISSIENLSGFILAVAVMIFALKMAQDMANATGVPGMGAVARAGAGVAKWGTRTLTGYGVAATAAGTVRDVWKKAGPGAQAKQAIEQRTLRAMGAVAPGAMGTEARDRVAATRAQEVQKARGRLKGKTKEMKLDMLKQGGAKGSAAAIELAQEGHRFTPAEAKLAELATSGNPEAATQLTTAFKKGSPHLAFDLETSEGRQAMLRDPDVNLSNLSREAFEGPHGEALVTDIMRERGAKGLEDVAGNLRDDDAKKALMTTISGSTLQNMISKKSDNEDKRESVKGELKTKRAELKTLTDENKQDVKSLDRRAVLERQVSELEKQEGGLTVQIEGTDRLAQLHARTTGRPDETVRSVADPARRAQMLQNIMGKVKSTDMKPEAFKSTEVLAAAAAQYGTHFSSFIDKLDLGQKREADATARSIDVTAPGVTDGEIEVKLRMAGDFGGLDATRTAPDGSTEPVIEPARRAAIIERAVSRMSSKELANFKPATLSGESKDNFYAALQKNTGAVRGLTGLGKEVPQGVLTALKTDILTADSKGDKAFEGLASVMNDGGWKSVPIPDTLLVIQQSKKRKKKRRHKRGAGGTDAAGDTDTDGGAGDADTDGGAGETT